MLCHDQLECEWHFASSPGSLNNHVSSNNQQRVSNIALFVCPTISSIMSHPTINREWVTLLYSCVSLIISLPMPNSGWVTLLYFSVSSIMSCPTTYREWVILLYLFAKQSHQSCLMTNRRWVTLHFFVSLIISHPITNREWVTLHFSLPGSLINHAMTNRW